MLGQWPTDPALRKRWANIRELIAEQLLTKSKKVAQFAYFLTIYSASMKIHSSPFSPVPVTGTGETDEEV